MMEFQLSVPVSAACRIDHFPGQPVVPGALVCAAVSIELERRTGKPVTGLEKLRFSRPVHPEDRLSVAGELRGDQWRLRVQAGEHEVLRGRFRQGHEHAMLPEDPLLPFPASGQQSTRPDMVEAYAMLPHGESMRLVESVQDWNEEGLIARAIMREPPGGKHPLNLSGCVHGLAALEYVAQACALHGVLSGRVAACHGGSTVVATVPRLQLEGEGLSAGDAMLEIAVRCILRQSHSAVYESLITDGRAWRLSATLGLMLIEP